jgi:hypothetical protein
VIRVILRLSFISISIELRNLQTFPYLIKSEQSSMVGKILAMEKMGILCKATLDLSDSARTPTQIHVTYLMLTAVCWEAKVFWLLCWRWNSAEVRRSKIILALCLGRVIQSSFNSCETSSLVQVLIVCYQHSCNNGSILWVPCFQYYHAMVCCQLEWTFET